MPLRNIAAAVALGLAVVVGYAGIPRHADLRRFVPAETAHLETAMWRDYYDKRYGALLYHLYETSRPQFGFSPLDSIRIALSAALAANAFQPTHSRSQAQAALPDLVAYYALLRERAPVAFDVHEAACTELDWWQARREAAGPRSYGVTVARVAAADLRQACRRSRDPRFRDGARASDGRPGRLRSGPTVADWPRIEQALRHGYETLKTAVARN